MATKNSSRITDSTTVLFIVYCTFAQTAIQTHGQIPAFSPCQPLLAFPEDTPIGDSLFSIQAEVRKDAFPTNNLTLYTANPSTEVLVNLTQAVYGPGITWSSDVILVSALDRDYEPSNRRLLFRARDTFGQESNLICSIIITDVNDNAPTFQGLPYDMRVKENVTVGTVLKDGITATDPDTQAGGQVTLKAEFPDSAVEVMFNTTTRVSGTGETMDIILAEALDYETRTAYDFTLIAQDGEGLNTTAKVKVTVIDVQDTPPFFLLDSYRAAIRENEPVGTTIIQVSAQDGDRGASNRVVYSIVDGNRDYFAIDNVTGVITSQVVLDRDNSTMVGSEGVFELTVRATEMDDVQPQYGDTTADVTVVIVVDDINDHWPTFGSSGPYTAFVREDTPRETLIYFEGDGYISVSDIDQGHNSRFNLTVERDGVPWPKLAAVPSEVFYEALVLLRVMDTDVFKDAGDTHIFLQVVAREVSTVERHSSTAEVVITVQPTALPSPTPAAALDDGITAPDVMVYVIGFLVVFNIVATVIIIWSVRKRSQRPAQTLVRKGSTYHVNRVERESRDSWGNQNGSAVTLSPDSILREADGKDRCDVVPLDSVSADRRSADVSHSSNTVNFDPLEQDHRGLLANEVTPAKSSSVSVITTGVNIRTSPTPTTVTTLSSSTPDLPNFSMARRNVSSPQSPVLSFNGSVTTTTPSSNTTTFRMATTSFPSSSAPSLTSLSSSTASLVPVTRFSAHGTVSTTIQEVQATSAGQSGAGPSGEVQSGAGQSGAGQSDECQSGEGQSAYATVSVSAVADVESTAIKRPVSEILY